MGISLCPRDSQPSCLLVESEKQQKVARAFGPLALGWEMGMKILASALPSTEWPSAGP